MSASPLKDARIFELIRKNVDAWIWGDEERALIFFAPSAPNDAEIAASYGFQLAPSPRGLRLIHAGHDVEAS